MRFIYLVLIGLVIFNSVLITISPFFPASDEEKHASDVNNLGIDGQKYSSLDTGLFFNLWAQALSVGGTIFLAATVLAVLSQQYALFMGIGGFIGFIIGLWSATSGVVLKISNSPYVNSFIWIIFVCIGILSVASVLEMLNAQRGAD